MFKPSVRDVCGSSCRVSSKYMDSVAWTLTTMNCNKSAVWTQLGTPQDAVPELESGAHCTTHSSPSPLPYHLLKSSSLVTPKSASETPPTTPYTPLTVSTKVHTRFSSSSLLNSFDHFFRYEWEGYATWPPFTRL